MTEVELPEALNAGDRYRKLIYISVALLLVALAVAGAIVFRKDRETDVALRRAEVLQTRLADAGFSAPDPQVIADTMGEDGGFVCQDPTSPLIRARYRAAISNGASGPGNRPVIADSEVFTATALAIETYCPDQLAGYLEATGTLKKGDTVKPDEPK
ncbi:hypothetical protein [Nocardia inohanensis]|uniref:hypothetical protein n=1 Tax=Nocardia inohanensis TaxID=209246 RepID=UPI000833D0E7|nr:hypothetical protein [Nocardia inohanensis]